MRVAALLPPEVRARVVGAEWWVRALHSGGGGGGGGGLLHEKVIPGLRFHYDHDVMRRRASGAWRYPLLTSVLYLDDGGGSAGPTIVLNQTRSPTRADGGWLVEALPGAFVVFRGRLLHAVLPGRPVGGENGGAGAGAGADAPSGLRRLSLNVAWWGTRPMCALARGGGRPGADGDGDRSPEEAVRAIGACVALPRQLMSPDHAAGASAGEGGGIPPNDRGSDTGPSLASLEPWQRRAAANWMSELPLRDDLKAAGRDGGWFTFRAWVGAGSMAPPVPQCPVYVRKIWSD